MDKLNHGPFTDVTADKSMDLPLELPHGEQRALPDLPALVTGQTSP